METKLIVVIIPQHIQIANVFVACLKLILYVNYSSIKKKNMKSSI